MTSPERLRMTAAQEQALRALCVHGSVKAAAYALGIRPDAAQHRLVALRRKNRLTTLQLAARLGAMDREARTDDD